MPRRAPHLIVLAIAAAGAWSAAAAGLRRAPPALARGSAAVARKPALSLTFSALVTSAQGHARNVSADAALLAVSMHEVLGDAWPVDGAILDFRRRAYYQHQRFFDELVCYKHGLPESGVGAGSAVSVAAAAAASVAAASVVAAGRAAPDPQAAFAAAVGEALQAPVDLYPEAGAFGGWRSVAGASCSVWRGGRSRRMPLRSLAVRGALASMGAAAPSVEELGADGGDVELAERASFCVSADGRLLAANCSRQIFLMPAQQNRSRRRVWRSSTGMWALAGAAPGPSHFSGAGGVAGGRCVDLTPGTTGAKELRTDLNGAERLRRINAEAGGDWEAAPYKLWHGVTVGEVAQSLGAELGPLSLPLRASASAPRLGRGLALVGEAPPEVVPSRFDPRTRWPHCLSISHVRNQGPCGSCWAFAAAGVLSDRACIAATAARGPRLNGSAALLQEAALSLTLSPQHMVDCDQKDGGCGGGRLDEAWWFLRDHGAPSESCAPYRYCPVPTQPRCSYGGPPPRQASAPGRARCAGSCDGGEAMAVVKAASVYAAARPGDVRMLQRELVMHGPVEVGFFVFSDFHSYRDGVYFRTPGAYGPLGGHAVRLLGWGTLELKRGEVDYWLAANSWSPLWGAGGFFRIRRGTNECGFETTPAAGLPELAPAQA